MFVVFVYVFCVSPSAFSLVGSSSLPQWQLVFIMSNHPNIFRIPDNNEYTIGMSTRHASMYRERYISLYPHYIFLSCEQSMQWEYPQGLKVRVSIPIPPSTVTPTRTYHPPLYRPGRSSGKKGRSCRPEVPWTPSGRLIDPSMKT